MYIINSLWQQRDPYSWNTGIQMKILLLLFDTLEYIHFLLLLDKSISFLSNLFPRKQCYDIYSRIPLLLSVLKKAVFI